MNIRQPKLILTWVFLLVLPLLRLPSLDGIRAAAATAGTGIAPLRLSATGISSSISSSSGGGNTGSGGASKAGSGSRRYSMDDFGVQIAHRAELHTSNVSATAVRPRRRSARHTSETTIALSPRESAHVPQVIWKGRFLFAACCDSCSPFGISSAGTSVAAPPTRIAFTLPRSSLTAPSHLSVRICFKTIRWRWYPPAERRRWRKLCGT